MNYSRAAILAFFLTSAAVPSFAQSDIAKIFARHAVWIRESATWKQDPGEPKQSWTNATILYFGQDGKFGMVSGVVVRRGNRMSLSEGEGQSVSSGTWALKGEAIQLSYRLISQYKVMRPAGEGPPEIPGPIQDAEATLKQTKSPEAKYIGYLKFRDEKYETAAGFRISELTSRLQIPDPNAANRPH